MKILAQLIRRQLRLETNEFGYCAVYEDELQRVWPKNEENRKAKIAQFAKEHGFRLIYYKLGLCAIFVEDSSEIEARTREKPRSDHAAP
ncbi:MAG: hypothetical protein ACM3NN_12295 [Nitrospirota bacterium]